jgi:hypothetical protein
MKIDVEGAEELVLRGVAPVFDALNVDRCVIEIDNANLERCGSSASRVYELMDAAGFEPRFGLDTSRHYDEVFERR